MTTTEYEKALHVGPESSYANATPVFDRDYESKTDQHTVGSIKIKSNGFGSMKKGQRTTRVKVRFVGGTGHFELDVLTGGMGLIFQCGSATSTNTVDPDDAAFHIQVHDSGERRTPQQTIATQAARTTDDGERTLRDYLGGTITSWELSQGTGDDDALKLTFDVDYQRVVPASVEAAAHALLDYLFYDWTEWVCELDGVAYQPTGFSLSWDGGYTTDRRAPGVLKRRDVRGGVGEYTLTLDLPYDNDDAYQAWLAQDEHTLRNTWTAEDGSSLEVYNPCIRFDGKEAEEGGPQEIPTYGTVPFEVFATEDDPAVRITNRTKDSTY